MEPQPSRGTTTAATQNSNKGQRQGCHQRADNAAADAGRGTSCGRPCPHNARRHHLGTLAEDVDQAWKDESLNVMHGAMRICWPTTQHISWHGAWPKQHCGGPCPHNGRRADRLSERFEGVLGDKPHDHPRPLLATHDRQHALYGCILATLDTVPEMQLVLDNKAIPLEVIATQWTPQPAQFALPPTGTYAANMGRYVSDRLCCRIDEGVTCTCCALSVHASHTYPQAYAWLANHGQQVKITIPAVGLAMPMLLHPSFHPRPRRTTTPHTTAPCVVVYVPSRCEH